MSGALAMPEAVELASEILDGVALSVHGRGQRLLIELEADDLPEAARLIRDDPRIDGRYLVMVAGLDGGGSLEAAYLLRSLDHPLVVEMRVELDRESPVVPTVTHLWQGANWHEREAYDMFGIIFDGHPDLRRLLNREDLDSFPLRKDARPRRKVRPEWRWDGLEPPRRLPDEPPRSERS